MLVTKARRGPSFFAWLLGVPVAGFLFTLTATVGAVLAIPFVMQPYPANAPLTVDQTEAMFDRLAAWRPTSTGGDEVYLASTRVMQVSDKCAQALQAEGEKQSFHVQLLVAACESSWAAYDFTDNYAGDVTLLRMPPGPGNILRLVESERSIQMTWRMRGSAFVLLVSCGSGLDCRLQVDALLSQLAQQLRGLPMADPVPRRNGVASIISIPLAAWTIYVFPLRVWRFARRPKFDSRSTSPRYWDLTAEMGAVRRQVLRAWLKPSGCVLAVLGVGSLASGIHGQNVTLIVAGLTEVHLAVGCFILVHRIPRPHSGIGEKIDVEASGLRGRLGHVATSAGSALTVLLICYFCLVAVGSDMNEPGGRDFYYSALNEEDDNPVRGYIAGLLAVNLLSFEDGGGMIYSFSVLPCLLLAAGLSRFGRRLRAAELFAAIQADKRPPILYLRSFEEDRLKVSAPSLRRTLAERLLGRRMRRFEEVLAWSLSRYGPVTAISPPGRKLATLGAAKMTLPHEGWQSEIERMSREALAVVGRNLHRLGALLLAEEADRLRKAEHKRAA